MRPVSTNYRVSGFTLIELIVVIVIMAILAAVALPRFTNIQRDARIAKLNAARGSVAAASAMVHSTVLARNGVPDTVVCPGSAGTADNSRGATGTVCAEGGILNMVWGYPAAGGVGTPGILSAAGLTTTFTPSAANIAAEGYTYAQAGNVSTFGVTGATTAATCIFTYTQPTAINVAPVISAVTTAGC